MIQDLLDSTSREVLWDYCLENNLCIPDDSSAELFYHMLRVTHRGWLRSCSGSWFRNSVSMPIPSSLSGGYYSMGKFATAGGNGLIASGRDRDFYG